MRSQNLASLAALPAHLLAGCPVLAIGGYRKTASRRRHPKGNAEAVRASPSPPTANSHCRRPALKGEVLIWARHPKIRPPRPTDCTTLSPSPDARTATAGYDKLIALGRRSGKEWHLRDHIDAIYASFTPDGSASSPAPLIAPSKLGTPPSANGSTPSPTPPTASTYRSLPRRNARRPRQTIRVWPSAMSHLVNTVIAHEDAILKLAWSPMANSPPPPPTAPSNIQSVRSH